MRTKPNRALSSIGLALGLFALAALAGCTGSDKSAGSGSQENQAPDAKLSAGRDVAWTTESVTFSARGSSDPDGNIMKYHYDFGDGTTADVQAQPNDKDTENQGRVTHTYARGGEYTVTLLVTDDGGERTGALTDTDAKTVNINEQKSVANMVLYAGPTGTQTAQASQPFDAFKGADRFEVDLHVNSSIPVGSSEINLRVLDPSGKVLDEETVHVNPTQSLMVTLTGDMEREGVHKIDVRANSGGAIVSGQVRVYYA